MLLENEMILTDPRENKRYYLEMTPTRSILTALSRSLFSIRGKLIVSGVEHLPPSGGVVLAANHLTNFDVFPMQYAIPRPIYFMGKAELFQNPLMDALLRRLGGFPVYRGARDSWAIQHSAMVLEKGQVLGIFPEGTRSKGRGLRVARSGAARLAIESGCPVVPMAVTNTHLLFQNFPARTPVTITLGPPIYTSHHDSPLDLTDRIMFTLASMLPKELRGVYAEIPKGFGA